MIMSQSDFFPIMQEIKITMIMTVMMMMMIIIRKKKLI